MFSWLFGKKKQKSDSLPILNWEKTKSGKYYRLLTIDTNSPSLIELGGVFVIWSKWGNKVTWLYVGATSNLSKSLKQAKEDITILSYNEKGGVGVTWVATNPKFRGRIASYLRKTLKPVIENYDLIDASNFTDEPFAVMPPQV